MGSAFHVTLAFIIKNESANLQEVIDCFEYELKKQRAVAILNYRERILPWPKDLRENMENALAVRFTTMSRGKISGIKYNIETTLLSADRLLIGRPDAVFITPEGPIIVDYKTGHFNNLNIDIYEDQICFYSGLWEELYNELPKLGRIEFILDGYVHEIFIDANRCRSMLLDARKLSASIDKLDLVLSASYGEHCRLCNYRPWCQEYWDSKETERDLEGSICAEHNRDSQSFCLQTRASHVSIINRTPVPLPEWQYGTFIRILDLVGNGSVRHTSLYSEIFKVVK